MNVPLLSVDHLTVQFRNDHGWLTAVEDVSFEVGEQQSLGIVGESGSGKSVTALSIMRLHAKSAARMAGGSIRYRGRDLQDLQPRELRKVRGREIAMIFQDPMSSLNPVLTVGEQIEETLSLHQGLSGRAARMEAVRMLDLVRIPDAAQRAIDYPHRLSGGMRQRVMIAIAVASRPRLLIADEPTTALDVTVQSQILELLRDLRQELGMSLILISHDLGVIAEVAERVVVMYAGRVVEAGPIERMFDLPVHPYTEGLMRSVPRVDRDTHRMSAIPGTIPDLAQEIIGCRFSPRCAVALAQCHEHAPELMELPERHFVRCPPRVEAAR